MPSGSHRRGRLRTTPWAERKNRFSWPSYCYLTDSIRVLDHLRHNSRRLQAGFDRRVSCISRADMRVSKGTRKRRLPRESLSMPAPAAAPNGQSRAQSPSEKEPSTIKELRVPHVANDVEVSSAFPVTMVDFTTTQLLARGVRGAKPRARSCH